MRTDPHQDNSVLSSIMSATADEMRANLRKIRASFDHPGMIGTSGEEIVVDFLNQLLPISVRAVTGKAVDSNGGRSKQLDVIIYDTMRTPLLFSSAQGTQRLVPTEGIIAVVEVKTRLNRKELAGCSENCASIKKLDRSAFLPDINGRTYDAYGARWTTPPVYYSVFAFESDGLYAEMLNDEVGQEYELHEQIDSVICLDRGLCLNASAELAGTGQDSAIETQYLASPSPGSIRMNIETSKALVVWYGVLASTILERIPGPSIDITKYLASELTVAGNVGLGAASQRFNKRITEKFAAAIGLDSSILQTFSNPSDRTPNQLYDLMKHPMFHYPSEGIDAQVYAQLQEMKRAANEHERSIWLREWFSDHDPDQPIGQHQ